MCADVHQFMHGKVVHELVPIYCNKKLWLILQNNFRAKNQQKLH